MKNLHFIFILSITIFNFLKPAEPAKDNDTEKINYIFEKEKTEEACVLAICQQYETSKDDATEIVQQLIPDAKRLFEEIFSKKDIEEKFNSFNQITTKDSVEKIEMTDEEIYKKQIMQFKVFKLHKGLNKLFFEYFHRFYKKKRDEQQKKFGFQYYT